MKSALGATEIPSVEVASMDGDQPELELSDDPFDTKRLDTSNAPCVVTLLKVLFSSDLICFFSYIV